VIAGARDNLQVWISHRVWGGLQVWGSLQVWGGRFGRLWEGARETIDIPPPGRGRGGRAPLGVALFLMAFAVAASATEFANLPLVEVPATPAGDTFVVFVSGDGGWASIDKTISKTLAQNGLPVAGLNALQYFWTKRTPDEASADLRTIIEHYLAAWRKSRVVLVGYSRGADVLPAMVNRLPPPMMQRIRLIALLGPSQKVQFEFHVTDWLHDSSAGIAVGPELAKITVPPVLCLWGEDDKDSLCRGLQARNVNVVMMKGAHHFEGGYEKLAKQILDQLEK
jgi:type IV secretory pathway VirJ component